MKLHIVFFFNPVLFLIYVTNRNLKHEVEFPTKIQDELHKFIVCLTKTSFPNTGVECTFDTICQNRSYNKKSNLPNCLGFFSLLLRTTRHKWLPISFLIAKFIYS